MKIFSRTLPADVLRLAACASIAVLLAACGGGGGSPGTTSGGGTPGTPGTPGGTTTDPTLTVTVKDGSGADLGSLSGGQEGIVRAKLVNAAGAAVPNAIVKFSTSDTSLLTFNPASGSALTDASGVATVNVKPTSTTSAGAARVQADSEAGGRTATGSINLSVGAAPLTVGALSFNPAPAGSLPAFSTVALNIPVSSGGRPASEVTGLSLTSLCKGDGLADIVLGSLANGVQSATYTNKGCLRVNDRITASIGSSTQSIDLRVDAANIGAIQFVGSDLADAAIVLKGSGGQGRKESALLTFRVLDQNNAGLAGVDVNFSATTLTGGLTVAPLKGTTDANGNVTTTVSSGTIPTPVRVIAEATRNGRTINGLSDTLTVSTGLPIQRSMSLSVSSYNIDGHRVGPAGRPVRQPDRRRHRRQLHRRRRRHRQLGARRLHHHQWRLLGASAVAGLPSRQWPGQRAGLCPGRGRLRGLEWGRPVQLHQLRRQHRQGAGGVPPAGRHLPVGR